MTCLIWNETCERQGNCLLYDSIKFRYYLHSTAAIFTIICAFIDSMIWYIGKDLDLYDDSTENIAKDANDEDDEVEVLPLNAN